MKRKLIFGVLILGACVIPFLASGYVGTWLDRRKELRANQLPDVAYRAITSDSTLTLYSLAPDRIQPPDDNAGFHGFPILGRTTVADSSLRSRLSDTLRRGLNSWRFTYVSCFMPRHGLRASLSGRTYDFVICFECSEVRYYPPESGGE